MKKKVNRQTMSRLGRGALITVLAGALSFLSSAPTTSKFADPKPQPPLISYQQLLSGEAPAKKPDVYYVLLNHPQELTGSWDNNGSNCLDEVAKITQTLYEKYNSQSFLPEGLEPGSDKKFEKEGKITLEESSNETPSGKFFKTLENLINSRKWNLLIGENGQERTEYESAKDMLHTAYALPFAKAKKRIESAFITDAERIKIAEESNKEFEKVWSKFFTPEMTAKFYKFGVTNRDTRYAEACKQAKETGKTPVTVLYGSGHIKTFSEQLEAKGLSYQIIKPGSLKEINPITPGKFKEHFKLRITLDKKR